MNRKVSLGVAISVVILAVALAISATMLLAMRQFSSLVSDVGKRQVLYDYLGEIDAAARAGYTIDEDLLRREVAEGYLAGLNDPYAQYLSAEEYSEVQSELAGNRTGFGMEIIVSDDNELLVSYVEVNSPAALAGVTAGDALVKVDEEEVTGASYTAVEGKLGTAEKLLITFKPTTDLESTVELTANTYSHNCVEGEIKQDNVGYIRIRGFDSLTALQFKDMYNDLLGKGAQYFVFDLRGNTGGKLEAVQEILGYLLPSGPYVTCEKKTGTETFSATDPYEMTAPSVTLVNGSTTGEAELFAAVLQDLGKTRLVGTSTAGKAVVQEYVTLLSDKAAVKLTTGTLYCINSGESWQTTGLLPTQTVDLSYSKLMRFELLTDTEDDQLQAALKLVKSTQSAVPSTTTTTASTAATTTTAN